MFSREQSLEWASLFIETPDCDWCPWGSESKKVQDVCAYGFCTLEPEELVKRLAGTDICTVENYPAWKEVKNSQAIEDAFDAGLFDDLFGEKSQEGTMGFSGAELKWANNFLKGEPNMLCSDCFAYPCFTPSIRPCFSSVEDVILAARSHGVDMSEGVKGDVKTCAILEVKGTEKVSENSAEVLGAVKDLNLFRLTLQGIEDSEWFVVAKDIPSAIEKLRGLKNGNGEFYLKDCFVSTVEMLAGYPFSGFGACLIL